MAHKAISVRLADESGSVYRWTIRRIPRAYNCNWPNSRYVSGWQYEDHDGYARFAEGNWLDLVSAIRITASNYGMRFISALN